jgi:hypothetical protein
MRTRLAVGIVGLCALSQGCGPITLATRTLIIEPVHYCTTLDNIKERHRDYKLAEAAWAEIEKPNHSHGHAAECNHSFGYGSADYVNPAEMDEAPARPYSPDYAMGFKDGFADYLYAGGTGEPPPLPPRYYWKMRYETPDGHQAMEDWFAGFRHGAGVARASGYREWVTIASSVPPDARGARPPALLLPDSTPAAPAGTMLPPPRQFSPPQGERPALPPGPRPTSPEQTQAVPPH